MTNEFNTDYAQAFDCGDGVPALSILPNEYQNDIHHIDKVQDDVGEDKTGPIMTARAAAVLATVIGQLGIGATILMGGNPVIGGFAALMMMICGLALALAEVADAQK